MILNLMTKKLVMAAFAISSTAAYAAQLGNDAKSAIPKDVQQIIVVDYRAMQNSSAAMDLKDRVLPPEMKRLETALKSRAEGGSGRRHAGVRGVSLPGTARASWASRRVSSTPARSWRT